MSPVRGLLLLMGALLIVGCDDGGGSEATCDDGERNGNETDVDCGGPDCDPCDDGQSCADDGDCDSGNCVDGTCEPETVEPSCDDGVMNGDETDTDCGGPDCDACSIGDDCNEDSDCRSGLCEDGTCAAAAGCDDGELNGDETDIDCGGSCDPCPDGSDCEVDDDCESDLCEDGICTTPATCDDGEQNGDETDVDCGGSCDPCEDGDACVEGDDCLSGVCEDGTCQAPACDDDVMNGDETDIDCGGSCDPCESGSDCESGDDCLSGVCQDGVCREATCDDGELNGDETDIDCGGSCGACEVGDDCLEDTDCLSGSCIDGVCAEPACDDGVMNGDETDIDCGGSCDPCSAGGTCVEGTDCLSGVCADGVCAEPACDDGVINGGETDIDCGGPDCDPCSAGGTCSEGTDCLSGVCTDGVCVGASCGDGVMNGDETDIDCGGPDCGGCDTGGTCSEGTDCLSGVCEGGECQAPACDDGVMNGDETDIDCGGPDCGDCDVGGSCTEGTDCTSGVCEGGVCQPPACDDGVQNGGETDIDCGGPDCGACDDGGSCTEGSDCTSGVCEGGVCQEPACDDGVQNGDETDTDCGGSCGATCEIGESCESGEDCASGYCDEETGACVSYESCQAILEAGASTGDGEYQIDPDGEGPDVPFTVYCDMTTDGGGWTAIDVDLVINTTRDAAGADYRLARTDLNDNGLCNVEDGGPLEGRGTSGVFCRYDFDIGFEFNALRTGPDPEDDAVIIEVEAGGPGNTSDLTRDDADWGTRSCGSTGDIRFGTPEHRNGVLSLGAFVGIPLCNDSNQRPDGHQWVWDDDEANSTRDTVLRLEFEENGGQDEGWRWESGTIYVRNEVEITGAREAGDPGMWADGTYADNCDGYRHPTGFYAYAGSIGDGVYAVQPDPDEDPYEVYCDMTSDGGGWTLVIDWDREHDGDTLGVFEELMTEEFNDMDEWIERGGFIQWSDYESPPCNDTMDWSREVPVPNGGEVRFGLHSQHHSMEDSSVWYYVTTVEDDELNLRCWDDHDRRPGGSHGASCPWTEEEEARMPLYECDSAPGTSWTWDGYEVFDFEAEIATFNFTSMASDGGHGDWSRLYWFEVWVR